MRRLYVSLPTKLGLPLGGFFVFVWVSILFLWELAMDATGSPAWAWMIMLLILGAVFWFDWAFTLRAYDDSDAVVLKKGTKTDRVPWSNIARVDYVTGAGYPQRVRLHLREPCLSGQAVTFAVSKIVPTPRHHPIADELHQRAMKATSEAPTYSQHGAPAAEV
mgnify:CR=1 FL=1